MNVTSDERVAIKVMLPSLAADPNVIAMFRREARSMTRLQHEALVQYRVLAQEPQRRILYIVTDYIDGTPLCDVLETLKPSPEQLEMLLRRLASGLRAAHQLGILHRDISPDNVLLEGGQMERAKIVDFGIAKDLNPGSATIIGDGFAGKLGYVAPEQLGDFDRELGPWTDVYSLALVMAAAAVGHDLKMGGTLVDAVDKRRAGPDLSGVSENMRPVLAAMLRANPAERLRSMDDVIAMLDARRAPPPSTELYRTRRSQASPRDRDRRRRGRHRAARRADVVADERLRKNERPRNSIGVGPGAHRTRIAIARATGPGACRRSRDQLEHSIDPLQLAEYPKHRWRRASVEHRDVGRCR